MRTILAIVFAGLLAACSPGTPSAPEGLKLEDYSGRWLVINYWAKWCKPCIKEIPELNALDAKYPQVAVLGVNYDGVSGEALAEQMAELNIAFPVLAQEPSALLGIELPSVLPSTYIVNPEGKLVHSLVGPQTLESLAAATGQIAMPAEEAPVDDLKPR